MTTQPSAAERHGEHGVESVGPVDAGALRLGIYSALATIVGVLASGPIGMGVVAAIGPSPAWSGAEAFVRGYHPIQAFPFFAGFPMIFGYAALIVSVHRIADKESAARTTMAVVMAGIFCALIFFNYICQTTFIPAMVRHYRPEYEPLVSGFSFSNPNSLAWSIEMWGYAALGAATWLAAPVFDRRGIERATSWLMVLNGIISLAGGVIASVELEWVMTPGGLIGYSAWNLLMLIISFCILVSFRRRQRS